TCTHAHTHTHTADTLTHTYTHRQGHWHAHTYTDKHTHTHTAQSEPSAALLAFCRLCSTAPSRNWTQVKSDSLQTWVALRERRSLSHYCSWCYSNTHCNFLVMAKILSA